MSLMYLPVIYIIVKFILNTLIFVWRIIAYIQEQGALDEVQTERPFEQLKEQ
jgi:hypothetical protein